MKKDFLKMLDGICSVPPKEHASYKLRLKLRDAFMKGGLPNNIAYETAGSMEVEVSDDVFEDEAFIDEVVEKFSKFVCEIYFVVIKDFGFDAFRNQMSSINFKLNF